jgi:hypothetical protein
VERWQDRVTTGERLKTVDKVTPYKDITWYIKWIASMFLLSAFAIRAMDYSNLLDLTFSFIGVSLWGWVGFLWNDRAILLLNVVGATILAAGIIDKI